MTQPPKSFKIDLPDSVIDAGYSALYTSEHTSDEGLCVTIFTAMARALVEHDREDSVFITGECRNPVNTLNAARRLQKIYDEERKQKTSDAYLDRLRHAADQHLGPLLNYERWFWDTKTESEILDMALRVSGPDLVHEIMDYASSTPEDEIERYRYVL